MNPSRIILTALAALRLTRFVTSDKLGEWWFVGRVKVWALRREAPEGAIVSDGRYQPGDDAMPTPPADWGWRSRLVSGLDCPFCVGFWIGAAVLLAEIVTRRIPVLRGLWSFVAGALALNYVTGHVSSRIDG